MVRVDGGRLIGEKREKGTLSFPAMPKENSSRKISRRLSPSAPPRLTRKIGGCRRAPSERAARVAQPPDLSGQQRAAEGRCSGAVFFGLLFLTEQEKQPACGAAPRPKQLRAAQTETKGTLPFPNLSPRYSANTGDRRIPGTANTANTGGKGDGGITI